MMSFALALLSPLYSAALLPQGAAAVEIEQPRQAAVWIDGAGRGVGWEISGYSPAAARFVSQAFGQLHSGERREAERSFRQASLLEPEMALAYCGAALASGPDVRRAADFAWESYRRRDGVTNADERALIEALARYLRAEAEPPRKASERGGPPTAALRAQWLDDLFRMARDSGQRDSGNVPLRALWVLEQWAERERPAVRAELEALERVAPAHPLVRRWRLSVPANREVTEPSIAMAEATFTAPPPYAGALHRAGVIFEREGRDSEAVSAFVMSAEIANAQMVERFMLPYQVEGYLPNVVRLCQGLDRLGESYDALVGHRWLAQSPRHPASRDSAYDPISMRDERDRAEQRVALGLGPMRPFALWYPRPAPNQWKLPLGTGEGTRGLADYSDKPTLLVFFLGFGCVHCIEQLKDLGPRAAEFERAGLQIVTIGTDSIDQVQASIQMGIETDAPPMPFPILCDPESEVFRSFRCWDEFEGEPLHGVFLIDRDGKIRWQDISIEPFMATQFLLDECRRLLAR